MIKEVMIRPHKGKWALFAHPQAPFIDGLTEEQAREIAAILNRPDPDVFEATISSVYRHGPGLVIEFHCFESGEPGCFTAPGQDPLIVGALRRCVGHSIIVRKRAIGWDFLRFCYEPASR